MLYATTFADALDKIRTMSEVYQNEKARNFLKNIIKAEMIIDPILHWKEKLKNLLLTVD